MSGTSTAADGSNRGGGSWPSRWHRITRALLAGLVAASLMFFSIAVIQTPGLDPPPETAALFVLVTTAGVISDRLLNDGDPIGYPATALTGGLVLVVLALVATGTYGPVGPRTNPIGPITYLTLAVAVSLSAGIAWRRESSTESVAASSSLS